MHAGDEPLLARERPVRAAAVTVMSSLRLVFHVSPVFHNSFSASGRNRRPLVSRRPPCVLPSFALPVELRSIELGGTTPRVACAAILSRSGYCFESSGLHVVEFRTLSIARVGPATRKGRKYKAPGLMACAGDPTLVHGTSRVRDSFQRQRKPAKWSQNPAGRGFEKFTQDIP
jgi:hypothetical protein